MFTAQKSTLLHSHQSYYYSHQTTINNNTNTNKPRTIMLPSSLFTRHLPRSTAMMAFHCARPAISGPQSRFSPRPAQLLHFSSDAAAAPTGINGKDNTSNHTTKDSLAGILRDELKLNPKDSKRAVDVIFDKIVEVRFCFQLLFAIAHDNICNGVFFRPWFVIACMMRAVSSEHPFMKRLLSNVRF